PNFDPETWLRLARRESVTHAMVVPTMLGRILDVLDEDASLWPESIVGISYGGSKAPPGLVLRLLERLPEHVGLLNAFGLTETSSTVAMLTPEDHRLPFESADPRVRARLESVGRPLP